MNTTKSAPKKPNYHHEQKNLGVTKATRLQTFLFVLSVQLCVRVIGLLLYYTHVVALVSDTYIYEHVPSDSDRLV